MIIAIDFDGTIVDHAYPKIGEPVPKALDTIHALQALGHDLILFTMRSETHLDDAVQYLEAAGIKMWGINENPDQHKWSKSRKVYAQMYIDDAALGCPMQVIEGFERACVDWIKVAKHFQIQYEEKS